ncbi:MAG: PTS system mannose/fructose/sorbose family transporter subunit IID [Bacilli bacterium]
MEEIKKYEITKKDLKTIFWRSFCHEASYNAERQQALGYAFTLTPLLKKLYGDDPKAMQEACIRHTEFFNLTVQINNFVVGIVTALEEKNANSEDKNIGTTISAVKSALMGPLAPIGDTFFWGCFRIVAASIGASLSLQGNIMGPILFVVLFNLPHLLVRWYGLTLGYKLGDNFLSYMSEGGLLQKLTESAYIVGLTVIGGMSASYVNMKFGLVFKIGKSKINIQEILDSVMKNMLPLVVTLTIAWLMRKMNVKPSIIIIVMVILGIVLGATGVLV